MCYFDPIVARNLEATGFESQSGRMLSIAVVHIQCRKMFSRLECVGLNMVLFNIKNPWSHSIRVEHIPTSSFFLRYCHACVESDVKPYSLYSLVILSLLDVTNPTAA